MHYVLTFLRIDTDVPPNDVTRAVRAMIKALSSSAKVSTIGAIGVIGQGNDADVLVELSRELVRALRYPDDAMPESEPPA